MDEEKKADGKKGRGAKWAIRDRNFERPNIERPIFRNLKITNVESYERSNYSIFLIYEIIFF